MLNAPPYINRSNISDFDKELIRYMEQIGFVYKSTKYTTKEKTGETEEYVYEPAYLNGNHYTLVLFHHLGEIISDKDNVDQIRCHVDHRLYIHDAKGKYVSSPYQTNSLGNQTYLQRKIEEIFTNEIRDIKLQNLLD